MLRNSQKDRFILEKPQIHELSSTFNLDLAGSDKYSRMLYKEMVESPNNTSLENHLASLRNNQIEKMETEILEPRVINPQAERILDAPEIKDDYYLNLLDWGCRGELAIGLGERVYLYSTKQITELCVQETGNYICSVNFHPQGSLLSVGISTGQTQIYDVEYQRIVRTLEGHSQRVSSSAYTYGLLYTGSRDSLILGHDTRAHRNISMKLQGHRGEVCGLKHDACGLASGSNDDLAIVWDLNMSKTRFHLQGHKGAVKALTWCPWQRNLLITGGGTSDKTMRMWNIETGKCINTINTESQVCSILCHPINREIISSHGYSENQLSLWQVEKSSLDYLSCSKVTELYGHTQRVLHMAMSPDASTVCTASADETLRFWRVFESGKKHKIEKRENLEVCCLR